MAKRGQVPGNAKAGRRHSCVSCFSRWRPGSRSKPPLSGGGQPHPESGCNLPLTDREDGPTANVGSTVSGLGSILFTLIQALTCRRSRPSPAFLGSYPHVRRPVLQKDTRVDDGIEHRQDIQEGQRGPTLPSSPMAILGQREITVT